MSHICETTGLDGGKRQVWQVTTRWVPTKLLLVDPYNIQWCTNQTRTVCNLDRVAIKPISSSKVTQTLMPEAWPKWRLCFNWLLGCIIFNQPSQQPTKCLQWLNIPWASPLCPTNDKAAMWNPLISWLGVNWTAPLPLLWWKVWKLLGTCMLLVKSLGLGRYDVCMSSLWRLLPLLYASVVVYCPYCKYVYVTSLLDYIWIDFELKQLVGSLAVGPHLVHKM